MGSKTFTVSAVDGAGNTASKSVSYKVAYGVCLLYDPSHANKTCRRRVVVVTAVQVVMLSDSTTAQVTDAGDANPDSNFRFDPPLGGSGGYAFNLKTTGLSTGTYALAWSATGDPTVHGSEVTFQIK